MNEKQITDLIERMRELGHIYSYQGAKILIREYEKLNKPEKVKIPQMVAEWLKENDWREETKGEQSIFDVVDNLAHDSKNGCYSDVKRWIDENGDLFARAWLDGYEIEKEKRYRAKVKGMNSMNGYLARNKNLGTWYFGISGNDKNHCTNHTRKELEDAGFGWVFDCEGVEVKEVE